MLLLEVLHWDHQDRVTVLVGALHNVAVSWYDVVLHEAHVCKEHTAAAGVAHSSCSPVNQ